MEGEPSLLVVAVDDALAFIWTWSYETKAMQYSTINSTQMAEHARTLAEVLLQQFDDELN